MDVKPWCFGGWRIIALRVKEDMRCDSDFCVSLSDTTEFGFDWSARPGLWGKDKSG